MTNPLSFLMLVLGTHGDFRIHYSIAQALLQRGHHVTLASSPFFREQVAIGEVGWLPIGKGSRTELMDLLQSLAAVKNRAERVSRYAQYWVRPELGHSMQHLQNEVATYDCFINNLRLLPDTIGSQPVVFTTYDLVSSPQRLLDAVPDALRPNVLETVLLDHQLVDPSGLWPATFQFCGFAECNDAARSIDHKPRSVVNDAAPVVLTMGSMISFDTNRVQSTVASACKLLGKKLVVVSGWSDHTLGERDNVVTVEYAPYAELFANSSCIVHHGGCGTVRFALAAAKPSILLPQIPSQEYFAQLLMERRLAAAKLNATSSVEEFAHAIDHAINDATMASALQNMQNKLRHQRPGEQLAADLIVGHARRDGKESYG